MLYFEIELNSLVNLIDCDTAWLHNRNRGVKGHERTAFSQPSIEPRKPGEKA